MTSFIVTIREPRSVVSSYKKTISSFAAAASNRRRDAFREEIISELLTCASTSNMEIPLSKTSRRPTALDVETMKRLGSEAKFYYSNIIGGAWLRPQDLKQPPRRHWLA